ncbi:MAG: sigma-54 dependent transcriptional regulator [Candidatus Delongbacteria bacterium]
MKVLLIDDDPSSLQALERYLRDPFGYQVLTAANCEEGLALFEANDISIVLSDIRMEGMTGLEMLDRIKASDKGRDTDVVLMTGFGDLNLCIAALRGEASDFLLKPISVKELDEVLKRMARRRQIRHAADRSRLNGPEESGSTGEKSEDGGSVFSDILPGQLVGFYSAPMRTIQHVCSKLHEQRDVPVLIEGETGTGKEVVARLVHGGNQESRPFISVNCSAIAPSLFESELFGYAEGAFTGAKRSGAIGRIEQAQGGTLFLDEIGEMPLDMQPKLLRVIQERELRRVGSDRIMRLDLRIICATNRSLLALSKEGAFRSDLYYRLNTGYIQVPPLRDRLRDIFPLARLFLGQANAKCGKNFTSITREAVQRLEEYPWPGNIRELKSQIDRSVLMYEGRYLEVGHLESLSAGREGDLSQGNRILLELPDEGYPLADMQEIIARTVLKRMGGNITQAAKYLDIAWATLNRMAGKTKHWS